MAIDRVRFAGEPVAAVAAEDEATAEAAARGDRGRVRGAARRGHARRRRWRPTRQLVHDGPICGRACSTGWARCRERDGNVCYRYAIDRGDVDARVRDCGHRGRGRVHLPGRLPVRDGDPQRHRPGGWRRDHACGRPASTRSWCAPRSRPCSTCRWAGCASSCPTSAAASAASRTPRWSPSRWRSRARPAARADRQPRRRVDGHHPPARRAHPDAHRRRRGRAGSWREMSHLVRHRRLRRQRPARDRHRRRRRARAVSLGGGAGRRALRLHQHRSVGLVPRLRRVPCPVGGRAPGGRDRPARWARCPWRSGGATCCTRASRSGRAASRSMRTSSATSRRSPRRSAGIDAEAAGHRPRHVRRAARGGRAPGVHRGRAPGGGRRGDRARRLHRDGPGPADRVRADRGGGAGHAG